MKQTVDWISKAIIYEVNIRQYTVEGTFNAFLPHIPRLHQMGITVLWLMPIQPIGVINRKGTLGSYYSIKDYCSINPEFGTLNDFKQLVHHAHQLGIKVMIDWVANHTAWDHHWRTEHPYYYAYNEHGEHYSPSDWTDVVQLNHNNEAQQIAMSEAMAYWVRECNIDGFRCDMAHLTPLSTWRIIKQQCDAIKPLLWLGESEQDDYFEIFDIQYGWQWLHAMERYAKGQGSMHELDSIFAKYVQDYQNGHYRLLFTTNHDENSWQGTEYERLGAAVDCFQTLCALLPGVPLIYSGQEEPILKRLEFFEKDTIKFENFEKSSLHHRLHTLFIENKAISVGRHATIRRLNTSYNERYMCFVREFHDILLLVFANLTADTQTVRLYEEAIQAFFVEYNTNAHPTNLNEQFCVKPWEVKIFVNT